VISWFLLLEAEVVDSLDDIAESLDEVVVDDG
jgi:hypothetical protein